MRPSSVFLRGPAYLFSLLSVGALPLDHVVRAVPPTLDVPSKTTTTSPPIKIKIAETILAILSLAATALAYQFLILHSRRLASTSKLPMRCIKHSLAAILELCWPDVSNSAESLTFQKDAKSRDGMSSKRIREAPAEAIRLFYCGEMLEDASISTLVARGIKQCSASPEKRLHTPLLWLTNGSSATSSMIAILIWEWIIIWIVVIMLLTTLFHNGFILGPLGVDSFLRLAIALTYAVAFAAHAIFVWHSCMTFFTNVTAGASWSLLHRARFGVIDTVDYNSRLANPKEHGPLSFREVRGASKDFKEVNFEATLAHDAFPTEEVADHAPHESPSRADHNDVVLPRPVHKQGDNAVVNVDTMKRNEVATTVDSSSRALRHIIANGVFIAAVTVASGYLVWSSTDVQNSQLGSLGLLAAFSSGAAAMFTSATQLQTANTSFEQLLLMKEILINAQAEEFSQRREPLRPPVSFMRKTVTKYKIGIRDFVRITNPWDVAQFLFLGPGSFLLPTEADQKNNSKDAEYEMSLSVRGYSILFTTAGTTMHAKEEGQRNANAINVCLER